MLSARPMQAFHLRGTRVVACLVLDGNPHDFLGKELIVSAAGRPIGRITIEGLSTATSTEKGIFDFAYSGDEIIPDQLGDDILITEGVHRSTLRASEVV